MYSNIETVLNQAKTSWNSNSPNAYLGRGPGIRVSKTNVCNGNGAQTDNLFTVTGNVEILEIYATVDQVTNGTTLSNNSLALYDGTATVEITDSGAPLDLSGVTEVGGVVRKVGASATVALANLRNNVGGILDKVDAPFFAWKKVGATTYIQHLFTGDADTNVTLTWYVLYIPKTTDGAIAAV